ncbi:MAG TPA: FAD-binding oxidoreductase [Acidimicrobiia bacterium]
MTTRFHAIWHDLLDTDEAAALDPGVPEGLARRPDVAVVGGGILGVATAEACTRAGLGDVVLLERTRLGAEASGGALGLLTPAAHSGTDPDWFVRLATRSLQAWRELDAREGGVGLVDVDWLGLEPLAPAFRPPPGAESLGPSEIAELLPGLARPTAGVRVPGQARVNPLQALARLAGRLPGVATRVSVTDAVVRDGRVTQLATTAGPLSPGVVAFATGGPPQLPGLPLELPAHRVKGHIVATAPAPVRLPGPVEPIGTQLADGRLLVGGTLDVDDHSPDVDIGLAASLPEWAAAFLPAVTGIGVTHAWCCFRPAHPDLRPVLDRIPNVENAWLTSGHYRTGILMSAVTATLIAAWIRDGEAPPDVSPLSIGRFAGDGTPDAR